MAARRSRLGGPRDRAAEARAEEEERRKGLLGEGARFAPETTTNRRGEISQNTVERLRSSPKLGTVSLKGLGEEARQRVRVGGGFRDSSRVAVRGERNEGRVTASGPNFFSGVGPSLQPEGFNLGLFDFLGIEDENLRRIQRNRELANAGGKAGKARRRELSSGARSVEPLLAQPSLRRQKLSPGGTILAPATIPQTATGAERGLGGLGRIRRGALGRSTTSSRARAAERSRLLIRGIVDPTRGP